MFKKLFLLAGIALLPMFASAPKEANMHRLTDRTSVNLDLIVLVEIDKHGGTRFYAPVYDPKDDDLLQVAFLPAKPNTVPPGGGELSVPSNFVGNAKGLYINPDLIVKTKYDRDGNLLLFCAAYDPTKDSLLQVAKLTPEMAGSEAWYEFAER